MCPVHNWWVENRLQFCCFGFSADALSSSSSRLPLGLFCPSSWAELRCSPSYPLLSEVVSKWDSLCWAHSWGLLFTAGYKIVVFICNLYWSLKFCFVLFLLSCKLFGLISFQPGVEPGLAVKYEVLTTVPGIPDKSLKISELNKDKWEFGLL